MYKCLCATLTTSFCNMGKHLAGMMKRFLLDASRCFPGACCLKLFQCGRSLKGALQVFAITCHEAQVWISAINLNFHHTFLGAECIEIETTCWKRGHAHPDACKVYSGYVRAGYISALPTFTCPPPQQILNIVACHASFPVYSEITAGFRYERLNPGNILRACRQWHASPHTQLQTHSWRTAL